MLRFGPELRRRRMAAGHSLSEFAKLVHYSKGHLSRVENGIKMACWDLAQRCDTVLGASGELAALARPPMENATPATNDLGAEWFLTFGADGRSQFGTLPRQDLLAMAGETLITMPTPAPGLSPDDPEVLTDFRAIFDNLRRLGQRVAPAELVPSLITLTRTLRACVAQPDMLVLASRFAEFTGWMVQEMGDDEASIRWTTYAVELATTAGDLQMTAYSYVRYADVALYRHDAIGTVALAQRAQAEPGSFRVHSLAAQREAQGHAIAGDYSACRRALDQAAHYMGQPDTADASKPILGTSTVANPIATTTGWCLHDLGRSKEAVRILTPELDHIPQQALRARARYGIRLALALASIREIEQSLTLLEPILRVLPRMDSATIRTDLRQLARTFNRWHTEPMIRTIMPHISAALRTSVADSI